MGQVELGKLSVVAGRQAGCFSIAQANASGLTQGQLLRLEANGVVVRVHPRAFRFTGAACSDTASSWAAALQGGTSSVLSHEAALRAHGIGGFRYVPVVSVAPDHAHNMAGIRVHRFCDLIDEHITTVDGLRVTTLTRAVVDITSVISFARLDDLVDRLVIQQRRCTFGGIARTYRQVNRRGRSRIARLARVLEARSSGEPVPRSQLEVRVDELMAASGLPKPVHEMPIPSLDGRPGLVDRAWPDARLILEIDGRTWHSRERSMAADRRRDRAAGLEGWYTVRVLDEEVRDQPEAVAEDLRGLLALRLAERASASRLHAAIRPSAIQPLLDRLRR